MPMSEPTPRGMDPIFEVDGVSKEFGRAAGLLRGSTTLVTALDDVSLSVDRGESFGLVGESGSGKTTLGRMLVHFDTPSKGTVRFEGNDVDALHGRDLMTFRRRVQMVFQNPYSSLNPRRSIRDALSAGYAIHGIARGSERDARLLALLDRVGLHESMLDRHPHEFSGGQRQRIVIARALTVGPDALIADEPVSALDVSIQAQVLNLLSELRREMQLTVVFITHDLRVANFFCDRIGVLYLGRLVEAGPRAVIVNRSSHPYTRMLLSAAPTGDPGERPSRPLVRGEIGTGTPLREGCVFAPRCWLREQLDRPERCTTEVPATRRLADRHVAACHFAEEVEARAPAASGHPSAGAIPVGP
jgi:oligopeptide/dipeptide ABC transporter ATP-binding protein